MKRRALAFVVVLAATQGAGCGAHHSAHLHGRIVIVGEFEERVLGKEIRVMYRTRDSSSRMCTDNWAPCLSASGWKPLRLCGATARGQRPTVKIRADQSAGDFDACTEVIGVDYEADIVAFLDANGDGVPSSLEAYGVYRGNPLTRETETTALPLEIKIDRMMPDLAD